eukprot:3701887-Lingulodinium_polyedra.AAC.1
MLLITGGSPCPDLTQAGSQGGQLGLAVAQSVHFYALPAAASAVATLRPDLCVQVLCDKAG